eukprot:TRINITY_DN4810_c0_g1_i1.p1 TRINITY_DN4810_c0_g1~~TRINITY_DN4810_c0_g1_i1.p1  ORF type:complete len:515 (-),score=114.36 TRINITY_DN4810_c0_g1_i1:23-1567(-)
MKQKVYLSTLTLLTLLLASQIHPSQAVTLHEKFVTSCASWLIFTVEDHWDYCVGLFLYLEDSLRHVDPDEITPDHLAPFFSKVKLTLPPDRTLLWSGIKSRVVGSVSAIKSGRILLEESELGFILGIGPFCLNRDKSNGVLSLGKDCPNYEGFKSSINHMFSRHFAASSSGDVILVLAPMQGEVAYRNNSHFRKSEMPYLQNVTSLEIWVDAEGQESCWSGSLAELKIDLSARYDIPITCSNNPEALTDVTCLIYDEKCSMSDKQKQPNFNQEKIQYLDIPYRTRFLTKCYFQFIEDEGFNFCDNLYDSFDLSLRYLTEKTVKYTDFQPIIDQIEVTNSEETTLIMGFGEKSAKLVDLMTWKYVEDDMVWDYQTLDNSNYSFIISAGDFCIDESSQTGFSNNTHCEKNKNPLMGSKAIVNALFYALMNNSKGELILFISPPSEEVYSELSAAIPYMKSLSSVTLVVDTQGEDGCWSGSMKDLHSQFSNLDIPYDCYNDTPELKKALCFLFEEKC